MKVYVIMSQMPMHRADTKSRNKAKTESKKLCRQYENKSNLKSDAVISLWHGRVSFSQIRKPKCSLRLQRELVLNQTAEICLLKHHKQHLSLSFGLMSLWRLCVFAPNKVLQILCVNLLTLLCRDHQLLCDKLETTAHLPVTAQPITE